MAFLVQGVVGFCLAIQPADGDIGTIGRKYTTISGCKMCSLIHSAKHPPPATHMHAQKRKKKDLPPFLYMFKNILF